MSANAKLLLFLLAAVALLLLLQEAGSALTPFALGAVVAYILSPLADKMEARNINPSLAAAMLVLLVLVALIALPLALIPLVAAQIKALLAVLPDLAARCRRLAGAGAAICGRAAAGIGFFHFGGQH